MPPSNHDMYHYFRLALVTGLEDKQAVIAWADQAILQSEAPDPELIELSLSGDASLARMVWLLSSFVIGPEYGVPLRLLFARASALLLEDPGRLGRIILGLRLLNAEERLPVDLRQELASLEEHWTAHSQGTITEQAIAEELDGMLKRRMKDE